MTNELMVNDLIKLATHLDNKGYHREANYIDAMIEKYAFPTEAFQEIFDWLWGGMRHALTGGLARNLWARMEKDNPTTTTAIKAIATSLATLPKALIHDAKKNLRSNLQAAVQQLGPVPENIQGQKPQRIGGGAPAPAVDSYPEPADGWSSFPESDPDTGRSNVTGRTPEEQEKYEEQREEYDQGTT